MDTSSENPKKPRGFQKGIPANPTGKNGIRKGYVLYGRRAQMLLDKYSVGEIIDIVSDPIKFKALPGQDGIIMAHLANTYGSKDMGEERERLLNRIEGQAKATVDVMMNASVVTGAMSDEEAKKRLKELFAVAQSRLDAGMTPEDVQNSFDGNDDASFTEEG